ncbi:MAG: hypothetical protein K2K08_05030 [Paramuribaculum sp.]|nr:hypothetical protein [Paramuribaculum sp.]
MKVSCVLLIASLLIVGCTNKPDVPKAETEDISVVNVQEELVQHYALSDSFIDVDIEAISTPESRSTISETDIAKAKAAVYRFYQNVKEVDGNLVCEVPDGASINISETVFAALKENLQQMNDDVKAAREKGYDIVKTKPDSEYLKSLLD